MDYSLNRRAAAIVDRIEQHADDLRIVLTRPAGARVFDFGMNAEGGLQAGLELARVCLAGLGHVAINTGAVGDSVWPHVEVHTDAPLAACLFSQYAGWQISVDEFFGMGSGPMRAASGREELFGQFDYRESGDICIGVLEAATLPDEAVVTWIAERAGVTPENLALLVAPTSSQSGNVQVVARSVETAMHKLHELGFDVSRVASGFGTAPLPPVAASDLAGIGATNDAILYGGSVTLWVRGDDDSLVEVGPSVPAESSEAYGRPFLEIFEAAGRDFYAIDAKLFSPAQVTFQNLDTGCVHTYGCTSDDVLKRSFGL